jgi:hypothetical protein
MIMTIGGVFRSAGLIAQDTVNRYDFEYVKQSNGWLTSENAAGLQYLPVGNVSFAEIYANRAKGKFVNYSQSDDSYGFGAATESFVRMNPRVVFYGKVNYDNFKGKNMSGSVFINPDYNAIDILEYSGDNRGDKNLENYYLSGAVSVRLHRRWAVGGKLNYRTANYAKFKDLRHFNKFLDLSATVGSSYRLNKMIEAGVNGFYRHSVEGLEFTLEGNTDRQYTSLISFGSFYGRTELFGSSGYTEKNSNNPVYNRFHGVSVQVDLSPTRKIRFFNELSYRSRSGYYGKRTSYTPVYTEHSSDIRSYRGVLSIATRRYDHRLQLTAENERLENFENIYTRDNTDGGRSYITYHGNTKILGKKIFNAGIEYALNRASSDYDPAWQLKTGANFNQQKRNVSLFPFYRRQIIRYFDIYLAADRNFISRDNRFDISAGLLYGSGGGTAKTDGAYTTPSESQREPRNMNSLLYHEYEYLTASRINGTIGFEYSRYLKSGVRGYVRINYLLTNAFNLKFIENKTLNTAVLTTGCSF